MEMYWVHSMGRLPMRRNYTRFGGKIKSLLVIRHELNYIDMIMGRQI